jgi:hypothetical protein
MKIAVFMLATPGLVGANISEANAKAYCSKWGYDFVLEETLLNEKVSAKWNKILWLIEILPQYDAVFILDADAIFVNFNVPLGEYVSDGITASLSGVDDHDICSGAMLIRNTAETRDYLTRVIEHPNAFKVIRNRHDGHVINDLLQSMDAPPLVTYPQNIFTARYIESNLNRPLTDMTDKTMIVHWRCGYKYNRPRWTEWMGKLSEEAQNQTRFTVK